MKGTLMKKQANIQKNLAKKGFKSFEPTLNYMESEKSIINKAILTNTMTFMERQKQNQQLAP